MRIILLGQPGAGKGTQAEMLLSKFDVTHISTGDQLREAVKNETEVGKLAKDYMQKGLLVPDEVVLKIIVDCLKKEEIRDNFILDGFPRTKKQAVDLDNELDNLKIQIEAVLYFKTSDQVSIQRLTGRRMCENCQANYHIDNRPPKVKGKCDKCGGNLIQRKDDNIEVVEERLKVYKEQTAPLLEYYSKKGIIKQLNGDLDAEEIFNEILNILKEFAPLKK